MYISILTNAYCGDEPDQEQYPTFKLGTRMWIMSHASLTKAVVCACVYIRIGWSHTVVPDHHG